MTKASWIQTLTGDRFDPINPDPNAINIIDIAGALGYICRFTGHTLRFYSVAQHSVLLSRAVSPENALWALLHDAPEAYLMDASAPVKPHLDGYEILEYRIMEAVCRKFGLPPEMPAQVDEYDKRIVVDERDALMSSSMHSWGLRHLQPLGVEIKPWEPDVARRNFIQRYQEITGHE